MPNNPYLLYCQVFWLRHVVRVQEERSMFSSLTKSLFGDSNDKELKKLNARVAAITAYEDQMIAKSDEDLAGISPDFQTDSARPHRLSEKNGADCCQMQSSDLELNLIPLPSALLHESLLLLPIQRKCLRLF